ncbi:unnamed protein product, partial [Prunus brigantina]
SRGFLGTTSSKIHFSGRVISLHFIIFGTTTFDFSRLAWNKVVSPLLSKSLALGHTMFITLYETL